MLDELKIDVILTHGREHPARAWVCAFVCHVSYVIFGQFARSFEERIRLPLLLSVDVIDVIVSRTFERTFLDGLLIQDASQISFSLSLSESS